MADQFLHGMQCAHISYLVKFNIYSISFNLDFLTLKFKSIHLITLIVPSLRMQKTWMVEIHTISPRNVIHSETENQKSDPCACITTAREILTIPIIKSSQLSVRGIISDIKDFIIFLLSYLCTYVSPSWSWKISFSRETFATVLRAKVNIVCLCTAVKRERHESHYHQQ